MFIKTEITTAFILSGGLGSRLGYLTKDTPKSLLPLDGIPMIYYEIENLINVCKIQEIVFCLGRCSEQFSSFVDKCKNNFPNAKFTLYLESHPGGTGTALLEAVTSYQKKHENEFVYILNGDIFCYCKNMNSYGLKNAFTNLNIDFKTINNVAGYIKCISVTDPSRYGLIRTRNNGCEIASFDEKPQIVELHNTVPNNSNTNMKYLVNGGIYCLNINSLEAYISQNSYSFDFKNMKNEGKLLYLQTKVSIERDIFPFLVKNYKLYCSELETDVWADCGTMDEYKKINDMISKLRLTKEFNINY